MFANAGGTRRTNRCAGDPVAALALLVACAKVCAADPAANSSPSEPQAHESGLVEPDDVAVSLTIDEHLFVNPVADKDYNGGGSLAFSGARAAHGLTLDRALGWIDRAAGLNEISAGRPAHVFAAGLLIFTPQDLAVHEPVIGDRPYASLFFLSNGRRYVATDRLVAYDTSLTLGVLGLGAAGSVQRGLHRLTGSTIPQGWSHQISAGGEPTVRYSLARQALLGQHLSEGWSGFDSKWTLAGSVGTVTEGSIALNARWGHIGSPWWAFTPEQSMYTLEPQPASPRLAADSGPELFALAGVRFKVRAYNAFLEGQFRHSDLSYSPESLNVPLGEAWAGFEFRTSSGLELRYLVRWESPELRVGIASRYFWWGSFEVAKAFGR